MKKLRDLIYKAGIEALIGPPDPSIAGIQFDSRKISGGDLFVAMKGTLSNGHDYIEKAIESGATAIVCEVLPDQISEGITYVRVKNSAIALGILAANYFDNPAESLNLVGVTGTNGKTTIATLLYKLFSSLGYGCGLISTIRYMVMQDEHPSSHTTPDPLQINKLLRELADRGGSYCFMEVSSHAIAQQRIAGLKFKGGIFTNLTHDHLDYHGSFRDYLLAKKAFFDALGRDSFALTNSDDANGMVMTQNCKADVKTYALKSLADFTCRVIDNQLEGLHLYLDGREVFCRLTGIFNAYNLLAVYSTALALGQEAETVLVKISELGPAEGRFETVHSTDGITAIVDYAHTPDALKNVLDTIGSIRTKNEQLIVVVGAGGDRDRSKRPVMARICSERCDRLILTSDNPRSEDPETILQEMKGGIPAENMRKVLVITSRMEAIRAACNLARSGDIILVAGKGHEKYQEIKGVRHPFDDKEIIKEMLVITNDIG
jgi:UDP-N-acetylmuramoyl-L-alanyl-D-glutamate--2,6-diaminopimelate ligase